MKFNEFLTQIRPLINASALEALAELPKNTLGKHYSWADTGTGQPCHVKHSPAIVRALCGVFGAIRIDNKTIWADDGPPIITILPVFVKVSEVDGNFVYIEKQYREVYDDFDFQEYFWDK